MRQPSAYGGRLGSWDAVSAFAPTEAHAIWGIRKGEAHNAPLRKAVSDLRLDELIFGAGIPDHCQARRAAGLPPAMFDPSLKPFARQVCCVFGSASV